MSEEPTPDVEPGIRITDQAPIDVDVVVRDLDGTATGLHRALFDPDQQLPARLVEAAQDAVEGLSPGEARESLLEAGVTALDGLYATLVVDTVDRLGHPAGDASEAIWRLVAATRDLGTGADRYNLRSSAADLQAGALPLLTASTVTPRVGIVLDEAFTQARREQREAILDVVLDLAAGCEVVLVVGSIERRLLWTKHRAQLPPSVTAECNPRRAGQGGPLSVAELVATAQSEVGVDSRPVQYLQAIDEAPNDWLSYTELAARFSVQRSTVRKHVTQTLLEYELVERFDHNGSAAVSLSLVGKRFLEAIDDEIGGQRTLGVGEDESVTGVSSSSEDIREAPGEHEGPPQEEAAAGRGPRCSGVARVQTYSRAEATAVVAGSQDADIGIVDAAIPDIIDEGGDFREGQWWYDHDRDELVVGAQWEGPLQYALCLAFAFTHSDTWEHVLTQDRLDDDVFQDVIYRDPWFLRGTRQLGYLKDQHANGEDYTKAIIDAREDLYGMTDDLKYGDYSEQQRELRRDILREAHGLIGVVTQLLDICGVSLHREVRIPQFSRDFNKDDRRDDILRFFGKAIPIASTYGEFVAEKILFEQRETKRKFALCAPDIDYENPLGRHIGSWTIVGKFGETIDAFQTALEEELAAPNPLQVDGLHYATFQVPIDTRQVDDRAAYEVATNRILKAKGIDPSPGAVSWMQALTRSVYDVTDALRWLGREAYREVESRDLIYALSTLPAEQLVPEAKPTVGVILEVLLEAAVDDVGPLTKREIAEVGGISESSVYDAEHWVVLEEIGLVAETGSGWEIAIALPSDRGEPELPEWIADSMTTRRDVLFGIEDRLEPEDADYLNDPPPAFIALEWPPDFDLLFETWPWIEPWMDVIGALVQIEPPEDPTRRQIVFGDRPSQQTIRQAIQPTVPG